MNLFFLEFLAKQDVSQSMKQYLLHINFNWEPFSWTFWFYLWEKYMKAWKFSLKWKHWTTCRPVVFDKRQPARQSPFPLQSDRSHEQLWGVPRGVQLRGEHDDEPRSRVLPDLVAVPAHPSLGVLPRELLTPIASFRMMKYGEVLLQMHLPHPCWWSAWIWSFLI